MLSLSIRKPKNWQYPLARALCRSRWFRWRRTLSVGCPSRQPIYVDSVANHGMGAAEETQLYRYLTERGFPVDQLIEQPIRLQKTDRKDVQRGNVIICYNGSVLELSAALKPDCP